MKKTISKDTIITNINCKICNNILPPHTVNNHLNITHPIHICPHKKLNIEEWVYIQKRFKELCPNSNCSISEENGIEGAREIIQTLENMKKE